MDVVKFKVEDLVKHVTDDDRKGVVTGVLFRKTCVMYFVTWDGDFDEKTHEDFELRPFESFAPANPS